MPLIGIPTCTREVEGKPFHVVGDKYVQAVVLASEGIPFVLPALGSHYDLPDLVHRLDGLFLTGSLSNVHPDRYGVAEVVDHEPFDIERDDTTLPLIHEALAQAVPLFAVCRGFQELNVALGGSLHHSVHDLPGRIDHRVPEHDDPDVRYGPAHEVSATPGGLLEQLTGLGRLEVNSLHRQALDRVADRLAVEAVADDGTVEAVRVTDAEAFAFGVQWHPEYKVMSNEISRRLFAAFGDAARERAQARAEGRLPLFSVASETVEAATA